MSTKVRGKFDQLKCNCKPSEGYSSVRPLIPNEFNKFWKPTQFFIIIYHLVSNAQHCFKSRPAIHSDFIWIIQIFSLKFSEIQITWLKIQIFFLLWIW